MSQANKFAAGLIALLTLCACGRSERTEPNPNKPRNLRLGAILDLTGPAASFGQAQLKGIELAVAEINQSPPCPINISAHVEDSRLEARRALGAATKLVEHDHVSAIVSITGSSMALATANYFNRVRVPVIDSLSSAPALTTEGGDYYFRIQPSDSYAGTFLIRWSLSHLRPKKVAIVYADSDWGQGLRDAILAAARESSVKVVASEKAKLGQIDFKPILLRIRREEPEVLFLVAHPQEAGLVLKQMAELGYDVTVLGSDSLSTDEVKTAAAGTLDGVRFCLAAEGSGPILDAFERKFLARYGEEPDINSVKPFDAVRIATQAACESSTDKPSDIRAALTKIRNFPAITGSVSFDQYGDIVDPRYECFVYRGESAEKMNQ